MKKKITLILLALVCALCCAFGLAACGGGNENETTNPYKITQTEWESTVTSKVFRIARQFSSTDELNTDGLLNLIYNGWAYDLSYNNSNQTTYVIRTNGNDKTYIKYDHKSETSTAVTESDYNQNVSAFISLIDWAQVNYDKFELEPDERDGKYLIDYGKKYTCNLEELKTAAPDVTSLNLSEVYMTRLTDGQNYNEINLIFKTGSAKYCIDFKPYVLEYVFDNAFDTLTNYTLKAGPSATDPDYAEYYLTADGFRMYTPNNANPNRRDGYYKYNSETDNYTQYTKQADNSYVTATVSKNALQTVIDGVHDIYMYFETQQDSFYKTADGMKNKKEITKTVGQREHHYFDIDIKMDENGVIKSATWKYQMTQGEQQTQIYIMELTAGNTVIDFPNI